MAREEFAGGGYNNQGKRVKVSKWLTLGIPALLSFVTACIYSVTLNFPFQFDDIANISKKFEIRFFDVQAFQHSRWVGEFLNRVTYRIGEWFSYGQGGHDPFYYRFANVFFHIVTGVVLFYFINYLVRHLERHPLLQKRAAWFAGIVSLLFMLHPVQTQTVSYVIQGRLEGLATLFTLATLFVFAVSARAKSSSRRWLGYILTLFLGVVACGTKEIVVVIPFLAMIIDWFFIAQGSWQAFKSRIAFHLIFTATIILALVYYLHSDFLFRVLSLQATTPNNRGNILTNSHSDTITSGVYFISQFKVILHYLVMFFAPIGLSVEYDWKVAETFFAPDVIFPLIVLLAIFAWCLNKLRKDSAALVPAGLFWFAIAVAPRSSIIPSPELICDYKTYLASVGVFMIMAYWILQVTDWLYEWSFSSGWAYEEARSVNGVAWRWQKAKDGKGVSYKQAVNQGLIYPYTRPMIMLLLVCSVATFYRNSVWETTVSFWQDIVQKAPAKARAHNNLGVALSEHNRYDEAIPHYITAIELDRMYSDPYSNLAVAYSVKEDDDRAIAALKRAISIFREYPEAYNNLGSLLLKKGEYQQAEASLTNAVILRPHYGKAWFNLGRLYLEQKREKEAWDCLVKATQGDLDVPEAFNVLGQVALKLERYSDAVTAFEEAARRLASTPMKGHPQVDFNLANAYFLAGRHSDAEEIYVRLAARYPNEPKFVYNLAEAYFAKKDIDNAYPLFQRVVSMSDQLPNAYLRLISCMEHKNQPDDALRLVDQLLERPCVPELKSQLEVERKRIGFHAHLKHNNGAVSMEDIQKCFGAPQGSEAAGNTVQA